MYEEAQKYLTLPVLLSPTRTELSARCHRRHVLEDLLHLHEGEKSHHLTFGEIIHECVGIFWSGVVDSDGLETQDRVGPLTDARSHAEARWPDMPEDSDYLTLDLCLLLLDEYAKNAKLAGNLPGTWRLVESEQRRRAVLTDLEGDLEIELTYQVDRLVEEIETGDRAIVDTKTAAKTSPQWRDGMLASVQQRLYKSLESERLGGIDWMIIEGIQKKITPGQIEYVNADQVWTPAYIQEARDLVIGQARQDRGFLETLTRDGDARWLEALDLALTRADLVGFNLQDCYSYYRKCDFYDLCRMDPGMREGEALGSLRFEVREY